jgi:hypothetical protein
MAYAVTAVPALVSFVEDGAMTVRGMLVLAASVVTAVLPPIVMRFLAAQWHPTLSRLVREAEGPDVDCDPTEWRLLFEANPAICPEESRSPP